MYEFRSDYKTSQLPQKMQIVQPGKEITPSGTKEILRYASLADKLPKENFFQRLARLHARGLETSQPLPNFGNLDEIFPGIMDKSPFPHLVGSPLPHDGSTTNQLYQRKLLNHGKRFKDFAHKPYRMAHHPWPEVIGSWHINKHDGVTYRSKAPLDFIHQQFRIASRGKRPAKHLYR